MIWFDNNTPRGAWTETIFWRSEREVLIDWHFEKMLRRAEVYQLARERFQFAVRRLARHARLSPPRQRPPRRRPRTCGAGSSRSARPPVAVS